MKILTFGLHNWDYDEVLTSVTEILVQNKDFIF